MQEYCCLTDIRMLLKKLSKKWNYPGKPATFHHYPQLKPAMTIKIFLVEDDAWFGELLRRHLSLNSEYEVLLFKSAKECLDNLYLKPDIISIDFGLPDMDGDK